MVTPAHRHILWFQADLVRCWLCPRWWAHMPVPDEAIEEDPFTAAVSARDRRLDAQMAALGAKYAVDTAPGVN